MDSDLHQNDILLFFFSVSFRGFRGKKQKGFKNK